jgi:hypothetical protein
MSPAPLALQALGYVGHERQRPTSVAATTTTQRRHYRYYARIIGDVLSAVLVIAILAAAAWLMVVVVTRVKVAVAVIRERAYLIWIGLAVLLAVSFAAYR